MDFIKWMPFIFLLVVLIIAWGFILYVKWDNNSIFKESQDKFAQFKNVCPDYWKNKGSNICENTFNMGTCTTQDFSGYNDKQKCKWAKSCNTPWEGIDEKCVK